MIHRVCLRLQVLHNGADKNIVSAMKPTPQWTALSDLCANILQIPESMADEKKYVYMLELLPVLRKLLTIVINDTKTVARFFSPEQSAALKSAVEFATTRILWRPIPAEYMYDFQQLRLVMREAGSRLRKLGMLLNE